MAPNKQIKITSSKFNEKRQDVSKGRNYPEKVTYRSSDSTHFEMHLVNSHQT